MSLLGSLLTLAALCSAPQDGDAAGDRGFVEMTVARSEVYVGERFVVVVRFGIDREFLRDKVVQPFRRKLEVPVHLAVPWFDDPKGAVRSAVAEAEGAARFALSGDVGSANPLPDRAVDGRAFAVFEYRRAFVATPGDSIAISAPKLRFAYATEFRDSLLGDRVPVDRREVEIEGKATSLHVLPVPESGQPVDFAGAIGRFRLTASCAQTTASVGETLRLILRIDGEGEWRAVSAPSLGTLPGMHMVGRLQIDDPTAQVFGYDLMVDRTDVTALPAVSLSCFDPAPPGAFLVVRSEPIALRVRGAGAVAAPGDGIDDRGVYLPRSFTGPRRGARASSAALLSALIAPSACALMLLGWLRARERAARDLAGIRARGAAAAFAVARQGGDVTAAFAEYLAAHLRCNAAAVVAADLADRLIASGIERATAQRAASWLDAAVAARYGAAAVDVSVAASLVEALEPQFQRRGTPA